VQFGKLLDEHDAVIVSLAENNFTYTAAFKNLLDWLSREKNLPNYYAQTFRGKQFFLLKASPAPDYGTPSTVKHAA
jgi:NAD(P)H-dependent FMN reductase